MRVDFLGLNKCGADGDIDELPDGALGGALDSALDVMLAGALDKRLDAALGDRKPPPALDEMLESLLLGVGIAETETGVPRGVAGRKLSDALASSGLGASVSRMRGVRRAFMGAWKWPATGRGGVSGPISPPGNRRSFWSSSSSLKQYSSSLSESYVSTSLVRGNWG